MFRDWIEDFWCWFLVVALAGAYLWLPLLVCIGLFILVHNYVAAGMAGVFFLLGLWIRAMNFPNG